ncbi:MAG: DUF2066 domain-containing protein [Pseudomonadota bacterium]
MLRLFVFVAALLSYGTAAAQNVFTVPQVPVYAEAETSAEAQALARRQGRTAALDLLLRRLVAEEDWLYLPRLAQGQPAPAASEIQRFDPLALPVSAKQAIAIDNAQLSQLEEGFDVFNEKSSGTTYRAQITFRFKPSAVRALLQNARIPYSEEQAREVLILPVLETEEGTYLWEAKNPWARAWLERPLTSELTPMVLPVGDAVDIQAITADEARNLNAAALRDFGKRYQTEQVYLAMGRLREQNDEYRLYVRLIEATPPNLDALAATTRIGETVTEAFFRGSDRDFPALARKAVEGTVQRHARRWKRQTLVDYSLERNFEVTAWYGDLEEWAEIRSALEETPLVRDLDPGVFNRENAIIQLTVVGDEDQFDLAMQQRGLDLWQDSAGRWYLAEAERAARLQMSLEPLAPTIDEQAGRDARRGLGRLFRRGDDNAPVENSDTIEGRTGEDIPTLPEDLFNNDATGGGGQ